MPWVPAAIAGGAIIGGALIGSNAAKKQSEAAAAAQRALMERLDAAQLPDIEEQKLNYEMNQYQGQIDPTLEQGINSDPSLMQNIQVDPRLREAQMSALQQLSQYGQTPFTEADSAALRDVRRQASADEHARQSAILQSMAQRGMGGSGAELAARLSSSQASTDRASAEGDRLAQMAQQRALQSISQSGTLGTQVAGQQFDQAAKIANAQDVINQFNTQNQRDVQQRNVGIKNTIDAQTQADKQRIAESNVALRNQQQTNNKNLYQQQFNNQIAKATGQVSAASPYIQSQMQQAGNTAQSWMNMGQGVAKTTLGIAELYKPKDTAKTDTDTSSDVTRV
jgi:hypothetical protein